MTYRSLLRVLIVLLVLLLTLGLYACGEEAPAATPTEIETTAVPTEPHVKEQIFFNVDKLLDKDLVRNKDRATGLYNLRFFVDGEYVTIQTDIDSVIDQVDRFYASIPEYNKHGMVRKMKSVQSSLGGAFYEGVVVTAVEGSTVSVEGSLGSLTVAEDAAIYDMTGLTAEVGTPGQIQAGDKLCAYVDDDGFAQVIYIIVRDLPHDDTHACPHCQEAVTWTVWDGTTALESGHYLLQSDLVLDETVSLTHEDVVLCLDGFKLSCADRVFYLSGSAKLSVTDHAGFTGVYNGHIVGGGIPAAGLEETQLLGGTIYAENGTELNLYGGELRSGITGETNRKIYRGGTVYSMGTVNLYDGTITGGNVVNRGGGLYLAKDGVFNMEGGVIRYGNAGNCGGTACFANDCAQVNISGGKLIAGIAVSMGGGIYTEKSMVVSGGEFTGDLSDGDNAEYGGVFATGKNIEVEFLDGVVFYGGSAIEGGNISCRLNCHMTLHEGVVVRDGNASRSGGNIVNFGNLDIKGAKILNGVSVNGGGNLYTYSNGNTVTNFYSGEMIGGVGNVGGNVRLAGNPALYEQGSILNVYGGVIADGEAVNGNGGNIYITSHSQVHLYGGEIRGGTASKLGGGICTYYTSDGDVSSTLSIGGSALVTGNNGSDIYINEKTVLTFNEEPLTAQAKAGISVFDPSIAFALGAPEGAENTLFWFDGDKTIVNENGELKAQ